jgi:hypothetical protein
MPQAALGARALLASPELVGAAVGGFAVGPMLLMVAGHFSPAAATVLGLLGAALACWLCGAPDEARTPVDLWLTGAAIVVALGWFAYNVRFAAQDVYATRDPAAYTISGRWLVDHASLQIDAHPQVFGHPPGGLIETGSYAKVSDTIVNGQGVHLLPVLLGVTGGLFGTTAMLATNTAITALALFVFFGMVRRIAGPGWGLVAMATYAASMPIIYVGRDSYTESLTLLFLTGALTFVHRGFARASIRDWALAGVLGGLSTCARVDSYGALVGLVIAAAVLVATSASPEFRRAINCALALLAGGALPLLLGWLDLTHVSRQYYYSQHSNITHLAGLLVVVTVLAPLVVWCAVRWRLFRSLTDERVSRRLAVGANIALVAVVLMLASRPLWQTTRGARLPDLENMQKRWGKPVDGTRRYNEYTLHWIAQYYGIVTVVLATVGYGWLVCRVLRRREYVLSGLLVMGLSMSALYLWNVEASPDQPWAMRRYVPVVLPLLLTAAVVALRWFWQSARPDGWRRWIRPAVAAVAVVVVWFPADVSWPMRTVSDEKGQRVQLEAICAAVGPHGAVVEVDDATVFGYGQAIRSFCNVPALGLVSPSAEQLRQVSAAVRATGRTLFIVGQSPAATGGQSGHAFSVVTVDRWPTQINQPPDEKDTQQYAVWLSEVDAAGKPHPVAPLRPSQ